MQALATDAERQRVTVLLQTGLRKSEFLSLRWKDVDLRAGMLTIPRSKNGETRHVPLTSTVRAIVGSLPRPLNGTALVFPNSEGKRDLRWPEKTVPAAVADAQIEDFRFHDLRHTFASRLPCKAWICSRSRNWEDGRPSAWFSDMRISRQGIGTPRLSGSPPGRSSPRRRRRAERSSTVSSTWGK
jgi:integrase